MERGRERETKGEEGERAEEGRDRLKGEREHGETEEGEIGREKEKTK